MKGSLQNHEDLEWLLAWIASRPGERVQFLADDQLDGLEFRADADGRALAWYAFEVLRSGACRVRQAVPIDGWWVGMN